MRYSRFKPALIAGFSVFLCAELAAQDYIDVEAERKAQQAAAANNVPVISSSQADPSPATAYPAANDAYGMGSSTATAYPGIRPYSGTTVTATPGTQVQPMAGGAPTDIGSVVIQLQQLQAEVMRLNGIVEEQAHEIRVLKEQSLERYIDIDRRLAGGAGAAVGGAGLGPVSGGAAEGGTVGGATALPQTGGEQLGGAVVTEQAGEKDAYQAAYDLVRNRNFDQAVTAFREFLQNYPFGKFAPNAHYWLGELYLVIEPADPELARQSFKLLLDQYPDNAKVPDALYKLGRVHFLKGNRERSREYLQRVIREYGADNHPAAQLAQEFLAQNF